MKTLFSFILLLLVTISSAQFKLPKKADWELANTKPIVILQLDENDENAAVYNPNIKKYAELYFGADRIEQYLPKKEFDKFIKKNKEKFIFIGFEYNNSNAKWFTQFYLGITGKSFMINGGYLSTINYDDKSKIFKTEVKKFTEADIKFAIGTFKNEINYGISHEDLSFREMMKNGDKSLSELNPNCKDLKNLTLLIDKNQVNDRFLKELKSKYKFKYEIVESSVIEDAILNNDKSVAFLFEYFKPMAHNSTMGNTKTYYYASMLYIYKASDLTNLFWYVPDLSGLGSFNSAKDIQVQDAKDYFDQLNSILE